MFHHKIIIHQWRSWKDNMDHFMLMIKQNRAAKKNIYFFIYSWLELKRWNNYYLIAFGKMKWSKINIFFYFLFALCFVKTCWEEASSWRRKENLFSLWALKRSTNEPPQDMYEWMNGWMDEWMNEWMDEWMDGWMDGWMVWRGSTFHCLPIP